MFQGAGGQGVGGRAQIQHLCQILASLPGQCLSRPIGAPVIHHGEGNKPLFPHNSRPLSCVGYSADISACLSQHVSIALSNCHNRALLLKGGTQQHDYHDRAATEGENNFLPSTGKEGTPGNVPFSPAVGSSDNNLHGSSKLPRLWQDPWESRNLPPPFLCRYVITALAPPLQMLKEREHLSPSLRTTAIQIYSCWNFMRGHSRTIE